MADRSGKDFLAAGAGDSMSPYYNSPTNNQLRIPPPRPEKCSNCGQRGRLRCSRCKTWYCSVICQENDWTRHRPNCEGPPPLENPDGTPYDPSSNKTIVQVISSVAAAGDTDSETNSDDMMSLQRLVEMNPLTANGSPGPLNSTIVDNNNTLADKNNDTVVNDTTLIDTKSANLVNQSASNIQENAAVLSIKVKDCAGNGNAKYVEIPSEIVSKMPAMGELVEIVVPIEVVDSPQEFSIRIKSNKETLEKMMTEMNANDGGGDKSNAKIGRNEVVACLDGDLWYRGVAISKAGNMFTVYLIDFGSIVKITSSRLFPLKLKYKEFPTSCFQVCLAGICPSSGSWSEDALASFKELVTASDSEMRLAVIFKGKVAGGRMAVNLVDITNNDQTDIGDLLVELGFAAFKVDEEHIQNKLGLNKRDQKTIFSQEKSSSEIVLKNPTYLHTKVTEEVVVEPAKLPVKVTGDVQVQPTKTTEKASTKLGKTNDVDQPPKPSTQSTKIAPKAKIEVTTKVKGLKPTEMVVPVKGSNKSSVQPSNVIEKHQSDKANDKPTALAKSNDNSKSKIESKSVELHSPETLPISPISGIKKIELDQVKRKLETEISKKETDSKLRFEIPSKVTVIHCESPRDLNVLPVSRSEKWNEVIVNTQEPPLSVVHPAVGDICLASHDGLWARALVVKISPDGSQVKVDLMDFGNRAVKMKTEGLRELNKFRDVDALVVRVGLAGLGLGEKMKNWGEKDVEMFKQVTDAGGESNFIVESVGKVDGLEMIKMKDMDGNNIADMCVDLKLGIKIEESFEPLQQKIIEMAKSKPLSEKSESIEKPIPSPLNSGKIEPPPKVKRVEKPISPPPKERTSTKTVKPSPKIEKNLNEKTGNVKPSSKSIEVGMKMEEPRKVTRGNLEIGATTEVGVCFSESPGKFYVCPSGSLDTFNEIFVGCQDVAEGKVEPKPWLACLVFTEECWYRAEVEEISSDGKQVKAFLLDYGKTVTEAVDKFKPLDMFLDVPGLVSEVGLSGVKSAGEDWSKEEIETFSLVADVGLDTRFMMTSLGFDKHGAMKVDMVDGEGNNITQLLLEVGGGVAVKEDLRKVEKAPKANDLKVEASILKKPFPRTTLPLNIAVEVGVSHAESPDKMFLCPVSLNDKFLEILETCQNMTPGGVVPSTGLVCLALADGAWYRAEIEKMSPDATMAKVFLLDFGKTMKVSVKELRPLDKFKDAPGLVAEAGLVNIGHANDGWQGNALENFMTVVDVGGDTSFMATNMGKDEKGDVRVKLVDMEGNDITDFSIAMEVGVNMEHKLRPMESL